MFGNNITKFLLHLVNDEGEVRLDLEDEIIQGCLVSHAGQVINERIASMLGVEIEEAKQSEDVMDTDNYSEDVDDELDADLELDDDAAADIDSEDAMDTDNYSEDVDDDLDADLELDDEENQ
jgi:hypothetical protein